MNADKKVAFYTLGCKLNFSETSTIARSFMNEGFERVDFNEKADIWCIGCISFELLTYDYLFELDEDTKNKNETYRDRLHLKQMFEILGKMPKNLIYNCDFNEDLFDNKCNILKMKNIEANSLENILIEEYEYSDETTQEICTFLRKLLEYDINKRYSAKDAYNDLWLN